VGVLRTSMVWKSKSAVLHFVTAGADVFAPVHDVDNGFRVQPVLPMMNRLLADAVEAGRG
jgi:hypothetical protein